MQRRHPDAPIFPKLKLCPGGGAPKPPSLHYDVRATLGGHGIVSGWGLTEAPILTTARFDDPDDKLANTEGFAMPGVQLRVVTHDGRVAAAGEEGELRAKGPQVMVGYVDDSLNTAAFDDEGYLRTGDLGFLDRDGYVVITGRMKDVIIRNGENISAKEVEDVLFAHPSVRDVAVIGLPDERTGERVCAVVAPSDATAPLSFAQMADIMRNAGVRSQAIPEQLEIIDEIPRNEGGKALKTVLRERFGACGPGTPA
jgi:acyl-CoA synthetase (AMP-forming)/AMP-acid ligase II